MSLGVSSPCTPLLIAPSHPHRCLLSQRCPQQLRERCVMCDVLSSYPRLVSKRTSEGQAGYSDSSGDHRTCFPWRILQGSFVEAWRRGAGAT